MRQFDPDPWSVPAKDPDYNRKWREAQKSKMAIIYVILEPETRKIRYVGSTMNVRERIRLHWNQRYTKQTRIAEWLRSLDVMPDYEILQEVCEESRWDAEEYWTRLLMQSPCLNLLNVHPGRKVIGTPRSEEVRRKMSEAQRGRTRTSRVRGEDTSAAKLTEQDVREIRQSTDSLRKLAARYGVSWITIRNVRIGKTWTHVQ